MKAPYIQGMNLALFSLALFLFAADWQDQPPASKPPSAPFTILQTSSSWNFAVHFPSAVDGAFFLISTAASVADASNKLNRTQCVVLIYFVVRLSLLVLEFFPEKAFEKNKKADCGSASRFPAVFYALATRKCCTARTSSSRSFTFTTSFSLRRRFNLKMVL